MVIKRRNEKQPEVTAYISTVGRQPIFRLEQHQEVPKPTAIWSPSWKKGPGWCVHPLWVNFKLHLLGALQSQAANYHQLICKNAALCVLLLQWYLFHLVNHKGFFVGGGQGGKGRGPFGQALSGLNLNIYSFLI